eukprot:gene9960-18577_t
MEYEGFKRCMEFLLSLPTGISTFVSDRHSSVIRHMKEDLPNIKHYFDLWHLKKNYVSELFETILNMTAEEKEQAMVELHTATPQPLCAEFDKETREEAVEKRTKRQNMCMQEVPATCLVAESNTTEAAPRKLQKSPHCRLCNNPMKGHKDISDCPRNQQRQ